MASGVFVEQVFRVLILEIVSFIVLRTYRNDFEARMIINQFDAALHADFEYDVRI